MFAGHWDWDATVAQAEERVILTLPRRDTAGRVYRSMSRKPFHAGESGTARAVVCQTDRMVSRKPLTCQ